MPVQQQQQQLNSLLPATTSWARREESWHLIEHDDAAGTTVGPFNPNSSLLFTQQPSF
jgi:hypothetical protein